MRFILAGLALALVACGDDNGPTEPAGDPLTADEAVALVEVALGQSLGMVQDFEEMVGSGTSSSVQLTSPCSMGGTVAVNGEASLTPGDPQSGGLAVSLSVTSVHTDCVERHAETGLVFTLNGAPNLVANIELSASELMFELRGALDGTVRWAVDEGRSGSCLIDLDLAAAIFEGTSSLTGQACGAQISETEALDFGINLAN